MIIQDRAAQDAKKERLLFGLLLLLQVAVYAWLILGRRMVKGHDTLFIYLLQYLFLAGASPGHEVALWMPNAAHGLVTNWMANAQGGLLQNALLLLGGVPEGTNLLPLFHLGMFFDELILLMGVWGLGRRFYSSPYTRFFVAATMMGSSFWADHLLFNFRIFYQVPLILSLLHGFLDGGSRWKLFLAGNLVALQFTGSLYLSVLTVLFVALYFFAHALVYRREWSARLRPFRLRPFDLAIILVNLAVVATVYATIAPGSEELRQARPGRNPDGSVPLNTFLTHGGTLNPLRYLDLGLGLSPSLDFTLYCGILTLACGLLAVLHRPGRRALHLSICIVLTLLFSVGFLSIVGPIAYSFAPPLHFFRYVCLAAPLVKLLLILLAGLGFESIVESRPRIELSLKRVSTGLFLAAGGILAILAILAVGFRSGESIATLIDLLSTGIPGLAPRSAATGGRPSAVLLGNSGFAAAAAGMLLAAKASRPGCTPRLIALLIGVHAIDVFRWKVQMLDQETVPLGEAQYALQEIRPVPYVRRRDGNYETSDRFQALGKASFRYGATYDFTDGFLHLDPPASRFWMAYWLSPFDDLLHANERRPLGSPLPAEPRLRVNVDPDSRDPYSRIVGATQDKIQFFSRAHVAQSDPVLANLLNSPRYRGDVLLLSPHTGDASGTTISSHEAEAGLLEKQERLDLPYEIAHFDPNSLTVRVAVPSRSGGAWLAYCDVWHPGWTATVNGRTVGVERAFLAYKAVRLDEGENTVVFRFDSPLRVWSYRLLCIESCFWLVFVTFLTVFQLKGTSRKHPA